MKLFCNICELLTLEKASKKEGRNITTNDLSVIKNGAILEENGKIKKIGFEQDILTYIEKNNLKPEIEDCEDMVVLPGFVDCHTHPVFNCNRFWEFEKRIEGATYLEISKSGGGINSAIKGTRETSKELLKESARKYFEAMLRQGTTTVEAKSVKFIDQGGDNTLIFFIDEKGFCKYQKFMMEVNFAKNTVDTLTKNYKYLDNLTWLDKRNDKDYLIKMQNNDYYFTVVYSLKED